MQEKLAKVSSTQEADQALDRMLASVNEGFAGGRVTKNDLLSWAVLYFEGHCFEKCIDRIRQDHFDEVRYLDSVVKQLKRAKKEGQTSNVRSLLAPIVLPPKSAGRPKDSPSDEKKELLSV